MEANMKQSYADRTSEAFRVSRDPVTYEVDIESDITLEDYKPLIPASDWEFLEKWAAEIKGKSIIFVNPTMTGGGVAMLRPPLVHMMRQFGIEAHWFVMEGKYHPEDPDPFVFTKLMHNMAQRRVDEHLTEEGKAIHQEWCRKNAEVLTQQPEIQNADIIVIDDPQPAPLKSYFEAVNPNVKFVWRNHIDTSHTLMLQAGTPQAEIGDYVMDECGIRDVEAVVAHPVREFMHPGMEDKTFFAPATIDPFDDLNRELMPDEVQEGINFINLCIHELNASGVMTHAEDVMPYVDAAKQRLCLIARFDESKGMDNAIELGVRTRKLLRAQGVAEEHLPQVVVVGNGSVDDPSGVPIFEALLKVRRDKYADEKEGIVIIRLPHNYMAMNALMYAIPISEDEVGGPSIIGMQMSFAEGMETRITDWISHGVPVIISNCGGMFRQVREGESGIILDYGKEAQTGTTQRLAESICAPLEAHSAIQVTRTTLCPARPYRFPWRFLTFFDTFPETVQLDPPKLDPLNLDPETRYDLIILAYPVWFLSPAPPMTAFLRSSIGRQLLADTPVVTVIGCRNMWANAHQAVSRLLETAGARHCDNVVVTDRGPSLATFITTPRWFLTGRNDRFLGLPPAGISDTDINQTARFGRAIVHAFENDRVDGQQALLSGLRAVTIDTALVASERIGYRSFHIWSRLLRRCGPPGTPLRRALLVVYCLFLVTMIITVVPVSMLIRGLLRRLGHHPAAATLNQYAAPSGEGDERMQQFQ